MYYKLSLQNVFNVFNNKNKTKKIMLTSEYNTAVQACHLANFDKINL